MLRGRRSATISLKTRHEEHRLVFFRPYVGHIAPIVYAIQTIWSGRRIEYAWSAVSIQDKGQIVDVS